MGLHLSEPKIYLFLNWPDVLTFSVCSEKLYVYPCEWNYRPDHCMYMSVCKTAETNGVKVIHGNRRVFFNEKQPVFKAFYEAIRDVSIILGNNKTKIMLLYFLFLAMMILKV